jgi:Cysteine rich repeat
LAQRTGTPGENAACRSDVARLCRNAAPDTGRVLACLQSNRGRLSKGCLSVLQAHGQ